MLNCKFLSSKGYQNPIEVAVQYSELDINGESEKIIDFLRIIEPKIKESQMFLSLIISQCCT